MERIINDALLGINHLLANSLITEHQHGFIRRRSTATNVLECLHDWTLNLQARGITVVIYFDFK